MTPEMKRKLKLKINIVEVAREFAAVVHAKQMYDGKPYVSAHLDKVADNLRRFTSDPVALAMAYLHDVLEDTDITYDELGEVFGYTIANGVHFLTDQKGKNRFERQLVTYSRLRDEPTALLVKLCDRITNMQSSFGTKHAITYVNEYERFKGSLYSEDMKALTDAWKYLDSLYEDLKKHMRENTHTYIHLG
jgi:(p)ppGpp synthase/HD superfamily hydrolase